MPDFDAATFEALPDREARDDYVAGLTPAGLEAYKDKFAEIMGAVTRLDGPLPRRVLFMAALCAAAHPVLAAAAVGLPDDTPEDEMLRSAELLYPTLDI